MYELASSMVQFIRAEQFTTLHQELTKILYILNETLKGSEL